MALFFYLQRKSKEEREAESNEEIAPASKRVKSQAVKIDPEYQPLKKYDRLLRKFNFAAALDAALKHGAPEEILAVINELIYRGFYALTAALKGRSEATMAPLLIFLLRYLNHAYYQATLLDFTNFVIDNYAKFLGRSASFDYYFVKLQKKLHHEIAVQKRMLELQGSLDFLLKTTSYSNGNKNY